MKFNVYKYLLRELSIGVIMAIIMGGFAGICVYLLTGSLIVSSAITLSLLISMSFATMLACGVPLLLKSWGKDPAIGSGPFATAIQDFVSIMIYFTVSLVILSGV